MAVPLRKYRIGRAKLWHGEYSGWAKTETGLSLEADSVTHSLVLPVVDGGETGIKWGRLTVDADLPESCVLKVTAVAADEEGEAENPGQQTAVPICAVNARDLLLYSQTGRYLAIRLEVAGSGAGELREIAVYTPGDTFMNTFPEVYRQHGSFFHRYMTVFSSIYLDFQQSIDSLYQYLDPRTAPARMLPVLAGWLGVDTGAEQFDEDTLRLLVMEAPEFNRQKGSRYVIERIACIVLKCSVMIVERSALQEKTKAEKMIYDRLYGESSYGFTVLAAGVCGEASKSRFFCLADQLKPLRSHMNFVCLEDGVRLDGYCYLGINSRLSESKKGAADLGIPMDGSGYLSE